MLVSERTNECESFSVERALVLAGCLTRQCVLSGGRAVRSLLHPEPSEGRCQPHEAGLLLVSVHQGNQGEHRRGQPPLQGVHRGAKSPFSSLVKSFEIV